MDITTNMGMGVQNNYTPPPITGDKTAERQSTQISKGSNSSGPNSNSKSPSQKQASDSAPGTYEGDARQANNVSDNKDTIIEAINEANKKLKGVSTEFQFSVHEKTNQITVKIMNTDTKEVIRELPPEKILDMVAKMWEMAGILVDEKR